MSGFIAAGAAILCFGSNFVPIKKFETGDGVFFQWILCVTIWMAGLIVNIVQDFPPFQPIAMLGGFLWCTGNMMVVPTVKCIGLSLGMLVWGLTNLLAGWGSGTFGLFGLKKETVERPIMNYIGVVICCASLGIYLFVKSEVSNEEKETTAVLINEESQHLVGETMQTTTVTIKTGGSWVDRLSTPQKKIVGISLSIIQGLFYGLNFDPPQYLIDHKMGSSNGMDYVFSHFTGILVTSSFYMLLYCIVKKNKPEVYPEVILPGFVSGVLWSAADICWFYANSHLSFVVAFPLITTGPGVIASLWGIFVFREIVGVRNYVILCSAFAVTVIGVVLIALSRG